MMALIVTCSMLSWWWRCCLDTTPVTTRGPHHCQGNARASRPHGLRAAHLQHTGNICNVFHFYSSASAGCP